MTTLDEFADDPTDAPPTVRRMKIVNTPVEGNIAGFVCKNLDDPSSPVYTTLRQANHFYEKGKGYAISDAILRRLERLGVLRIFVHTGKNSGGDVLEFSRLMYAKRGEQLPQDDLVHKNDSQTFLHKRFRANYWPNTAHLLFDESFSEAMDRLTNSR